MPSLVAITAAMPDGTGLKRIFQMHIRTASLMWELRKQHAVTSAAGHGGSRTKTGGGGLFLLSCREDLTRCSMMSASRICRWYLPLDRAGLVGSDGETHQGIFDLSVSDLHPEHAASWLRRIYGSCQI